MVKKLQADIVEDGVNQGDLVKFQNNVLDLINELQADAALLRTELLAIGTTLADVKAIYDAHTHECPGSSFIASRCSTPDTGAAENSLAASVASAMTDTSGGSVPPTLTNNTPLKLTKG